MKALRTLKISISGVRGVVGESLTPELLIRFAESFGTYTNGGTIVVGRDTRQTGEMVQEAVLAGLLASGCRAITLGICPTPTILLTVRDLKAHGGIAITASHNAAEWNALKFLGSNGGYLSGFEAEELLSIYHQGEYLRVPGERMTPVRPYDLAVARHTGAILEHLGPVRRKHPFKVVVDCCNGAGAVMAPGLLERLGCEVVVLHDRITEPFPHPPEPTPENLTDLSQCVLREKADVGFALDPDADRLALVAENGIPLGEEFTLVLAADHLLTRKRGPVVANLSTTQALDDVARIHRVRCYRSKIGEVNVTDLMHKIGAVVGGEGNGGVIYPAVNMARDAMVGMAVTVHALAEKRARLSKIASRLPHYVMIKDAVECSSGDALTLVERLRKRLQGFRLDLTEGVKVWFQEGWAHIRPSNTEPVVRVNVEAPNRRSAELLKRRVQTLIREISLDYGGPRS